MTASRKQFALRAAQDSNRIRADSALSSVILAAVGVTSGVLFGALARRRGIIVIVCALFDKKLFERRQSLDSVLFERLTGATSSAKLFRRLVRTLSHCGPLVRPTASTAFTCLRVRAEIEHTAPNLSSERVRSVCAFELGLVRREPEVNVSDGEVNAARRLERAARLVGRNLSTRAQRCSLLTVARTRPSVASGHLSADWPTERTLSLSLSFGLSLFGRVARTMGLISNEEVALKNCFVHSTSDFGSRRRATTTSRV